MFEGQDTKTCPKCGGLMQKWYLLGGESKWDCTECQYVEKIK